MRFPLAGDAVTLADLKARFGTWVQDLAGGDDTTALGAIRDAALHSRVRPQPEEERLRRAKWAMDADDGAFSRPFDMKNEMESREGTD